MHTLLYCCLLIIVVPEKLYSKEDKYYKIHLRNLNKWGACGLVVSIPASQREDPGFVSHPGQGLSCSSRNSQYFATDPVLYILDKICDQLNSAGSFLFNINQTEDRDNAQPSFVCSISTKLGLLVMIMIK